MDNFVITDIVAILEPLDGGGCVYVNGSTDFEIKIGCKDGNVYINFEQNKKTV